MHDPIDLPGLPESVLAFGRSQAGAGSEFGAIGADAQAELVQALVRSAVQFRAGALKEMVFLELYCGPEGAAMVQRVMQLRQHATPGVMKRLTEGLKAVSLHDFMKGVQLNLGGK